MAVAGVQRVAIAYREKVLPIIVENDAAPVVRRYGADELFGAAAGGRFTREPILVVPWW
jgi:hypothetical protein